MANVCSKMCASIAVNHTEDPLVLLNMGPWIWVSP